MKNAFSLILALFGKIREQVTWRELLEILNRVTEIGKPPALVDEQELREWLREVQDFLEFLSEKTETDIDDKAVRLIGVILEDDDAWELIYAIILQVAGDSVPEPILQEASERLENISPFELLSIVRIILDVFRVLRPEEPQP